MRAGPDPKRPSAGRRSFGISTFVAFTLDILRRARSRPGAGLLLPLPSSCDSRANAPRKKRISSHVTIHIASTTTTSSTPNTSGCVAASQTAPTDAPSSTRLAPMFENGSGEVLIAARVVVFAAWLVAASVPPSWADIRAGRSPGAPG